MMDVATIKKAYIEWLNLRYERRKTIPYKELDICLSIVERYIDWVKKVNEERCCMNWYKTA